MIKKNKEEELKVIDADLSKLEAERSLVAVKIDKNILSKYERILHGKDGLALAEVVNESCGGCHLNLPPQVINEIKMTKDIVFCESCARILYMQDE